MTSFAFILGVVPLVIASGAGARVPALARHGGVRRHERSHAAGDLHRPRALRGHPAHRGERAQGGAWRGARSGAGRMKARYLYFCCRCLAGCAIGPNYKRPAVPVPPAVPGRRRRLRRLAGGEEVVRSVPGRDAQAARHRGARKQLRSGHRLGAGARSARPVPASRAPSSSPIGRAGAVRGLAAVLGGRTEPGEAGHFARCQLHAGGAAALLGTGFLGPGSPPERIGAGAVSGDRRRPARRRGIAHRRRGRRLLHAA